MTKCDFCEKSSPDGKCYWTMVVLREDDCRKAIDRMTKALQGKEFKKPFKFFIE